MRRTAYEEANNCSRGYSSPAGSDYIPAGSNTKAKGINRRCILQGDGETPSLFLIPNKRKKVKKWTGI